MKRRRRLRVGNSALLTCAALAASNAAAQVWTGAGANPNWDANLGGGFFFNWDTFTLPAPTANVTFGSGFGGGNPNLNGDRTVNSLTFNTPTTVSLLGAPA